jgi:uncharacterized membrane protein YedE/YeeE
MEIFILKFQLRVYERKMMIIDLINFTPVQSFMGGALIGFAAFLLMLTKGRIMGASGILGGLITKDFRSDWYWRIFFIIGCLIGPVILITVFNYEIAYKPVATGIIFYIAAFLVGFGSAMGSGCTSGHGICGLSLLSKRSLISVMTFVIAGFVTVYIIKLLGGL